MEKSNGLNALQLKIIATAAMLLDHVGYCTGFLPLRIIGRLAFPIFLFLIVNGYRHTASPLRYALRLGIFAVISQVPFSLFCYGRLWAGNGNVFFTLLAVLLCVWAADTLAKHRVLKWFRLLPGAVVFGLYVLGVLRSDYGAKAILMAGVFYLFPGKNGIITVLYILCIFFAQILSWFRGAQVSLSQWDLVQMFSVLALPLIFCYNGQKGETKNQWIKFGFYLFYPVHLLVLWLIY